jgi:outer membrane protein OmpA-like peptidoglycan-associated protein/tetratricopeptide (TPR) repeat protein
MTRTEWCRSLKHKNVTVFPQIRFKILEQLLRSQNSNTIHNMVKFYLLSTFLIFTSLVAFSQDEEEQDPNCNPPSKKTQRLIDNAINAESIQSAVDNFNKAIEAEPDNAKAYYEYGVYAFNQGLGYYETDDSPARGDRSFVKAEQMFNEVLDRCEDYNAGTYYFLGVVKYLQKDQESSVAWFEKFIAYKNNDNNRFPNNYGKMLSDAKGVLKEMKSTPIASAAPKTVPYAPFRVQNVSSTNDEYFPMISPDNELMFYTRKLDRRNLGDMVGNVVEEFTFSYRPEINKTFDKGNPFKAPFNDGEFTSYGAATMSIDNKEMIICACKKQEVRGQDYLNCDLYETTYSRSGKGGNDYNWTPLESLGSNINTIDGWEGQPSVSADGNTLYFTSVRKNSRDNDIYISERKPDGTWGLARPFDEINTDGKDKSPFIHQDNETFYFVSSSTDTRKGAGGTDIFYCKKENGKWGKPVNIGEPINTPEDELGIFVSTDGELAYFSSRVGGDWNIYGFELYEDARPTPVMIMKGTLANKNGETISGAEIEVSYGEGEEVQKFKVNGDDGKYAAVVKMDRAKDVMVAAKKEGHAFAAKMITKEEIQAVQEKKEVSVKGKDMEVEKLKLGSSYIIDDILYTTASADLNNRSKMILRQFARFLIDNPTVNVIIQGHTDDVGDDAQNMKLSDDRARVVKEYLATQGVNKSRLKSKGFGETMPKVPNDSEENRAKNRRTEFTIEKL